METFRVVLGSPRAAELRMMGWNEWKGIAKCRLCGVRFETTVVGTIDQAEAWSPLCAACWERGETEDPMFWSIHDADTILDE